MGAANRTQAAFASMEGLGYEDSTVKQAAELAASSSLPSHGGDPEGEDREA
jgi:hypothetical protein